MTPNTLLTLGAALLGIGLWMMLARRSSAWRSAGAVVLTAGLGLVASKLMPLGTLTGDILFYVLAAMAVMTAVGAVTFRSPVYCAIWFAMSVLATAGLFMVAGAQFLAVATVAVYAGAIIVMFLFVLMLAQPEGEAYFDRVNREPFLSAVAGAVLLFVLTISVSRGDAVPTNPEVDRTAESGVLVDEHVAALGGRLFSEHLISVQLVGLLLTTAIVAAAAMVAHGKTRRNAQSTQNLTDLGGTP